MKPGFATRAASLTTTLRARPGSSVRSAAAMANWSRLVGTRGCRRGPAGGAGPLSNDDLVVLRRTVEAGGGSEVLDSRMNGGDLAAHYGLGRQADLGRLGRGDAILVVGADLHEEAPVWWLRVKQAAQRGASLIVAHPRPTRLDEAAAHPPGFAHGRSGRAVLGLASHGAE